MFGSHDKDIASDLPLWVVEDDSDPDLLQITQPLIGGWKSAVGKQWKTQTDKDPLIHADPCSGSVDLDSFALSELPIASSPTGGLGQLSSCITTADGVRYRLCPNTGASCVAVGQYPIGTSVDFVCQTPGEQINGGWSTRYDHRQ
jgi:hypothetical protein